MLALTNHFWNVQRASKLPGFLQQILRLALFCSCPDKPGHEIPFVCNRKSLCIYVSIKISGSHCNTICPSCLYLISRQAFAHNMTAIWMAIYCRQRHGSFTLNVILLLWLFLAVNRYICDDVIWFNFKATEEENASCKHGISKMKSYQSM